ncbi:nucleoporin SEH1-like isoform X2 [Watersipora subatra]|uniref:nucleoporin SEH1-like isoform X2 n=1 Tax=Watersipora subatra TaxID=2589382 RepID=UPI00355BE82A
MSTVLSVKATSTDHKDLIHDVSYNFYGDRMATCSSDQHVKVWERDENEDWVVQSSWKAHSAVISRVIWAHPEFGHVLATCSFDRTAIVWEELVSVSAPGEVRNQWVMKHTFVDSRTSVSDVKFAPKHLGLYLATCSNDGTVRVYEAQDVMNLGLWSPVLEINIKMSCSSISWCSATRLPPLIAVGCDDPGPSQTGKVILYEISDGMRKYTLVDSVVSVTSPVQDVSFAPNLGRSVNLLAIASKDVTIVEFKCQGKDLANSGQTKFDQNLVAQFNDHKQTVWRLCWNVTGTTLASTGDDGCVRLWRSNYLRKWSCHSILKGDGSLIKQPGMETSSQAGSSSSSKESESRIQKARGKKDGMHN